MSTAQTQRIDFIDLAKGVCMIAIVVGHCGIDTQGGATIPLFFIISGMFFRTYNNDKTFIKKKINGILIPFCFFYLIAYIPFYLLKWFYPKLLITASSGIFDIISNRQFFNGPIWFIITLFWCNIILYYLFKYISKTAIRLFTIILIGIVGWTTGKHEIFIPAFIDVAMTSLPFFALGYYIKNSGILQLNRFICIIIGSLLLFLMNYIPYRISLHYNIIEGFNSYAASIVIAFAILYLSAGIKKLPFVNYFGKNSLVPLCVHHMIYRPIAIILQGLNIEYMDNKYLVAIITLTISSICIPIFTKVAPHFVGQKDFIK